MLSSFVAAGRCLVPFKIITNPATCVYAPYKHKRKNQDLGFDKTNRWNRKESFFSAVPQLYVLFLLDIRGIVVNNFCLILIAFFPLFNPPIVVRRED